MPTFTVRNATPQTDGIARFKAVGYLGTGTSSVVESTITADREQAEAWAAAASRGEFANDGKWGTFADD